MSSFLAFSEYKIALHFKKFAMYVMEVKLLQ